MKLRPARASLLSEVGQGTLEYIMVLTVTVILFLTVIHQYNDAFRQYSEQLFDGYLACLLETGELPGRGGDCSSDMRRFNLADGRPAISGPLGDGTSGGDTSGNGTGSGSGGSGGGSGSGGQNGQGTNAGAGNKPGGGGGGGGGGSESAGPAGGNAQAVGSIAGRMKGRQKSTAVTNAKAGEGDGAGGGESLIAPMPGMNRANGGSDSGRTKKTALQMGFGYWGQQEAEKDAVAKAPVSAMAPKNEAGDNLKSKSTRVDGTRKTASTVVDDGGGFSFGYLLRIILITGIILAIVVFMGGQLMQIAKSSEK